MSGQNFKSQQYAEEMAISTISILSSKPDSGDDGFTSAQDNEQSWLECKRWTLPAIGKNDPAGQHAPGSAAHSGNGGLSAQHLLPI